MNGISLLALVSAGTITEDDGYLGIMQNVTLEHAHTVAKWLALTTNTPAHLQWTTIGQVQEIRYTPEQVREEIRQLGNR